MNEARARVRCRRASLTLAHAAASVGAAVRTRSRSHIARAPSWETFSLNWDVDVRLTFNWLREPLLKPLRPGSRVLVMTSPVVHLELHTGDAPGASAFYSRLLRWREEQIDTAFGAYHALELGGDLGGGIVACDTSRPLWLPYVEVDRVDQATDRAVMLGATVLLAPREGPAGWRSVVATPEGGEIAFWQQKR